MVRHRFWRVRGAASLGHRGGERVGERERSCGLLPVSNTCTVKAHERQVSGWCSNPLRLDRSREASGRIRLPATTPLPTY